MCVGKALTGGYLTMGVTLATDEVAEGVSGGVGATSPVPLIHGPTFMANPLACAVANASLDLLLASPWEARVAAIETRLEAALRPLAASAAVSDVRVREQAPQRANVPGSQPHAAAHYSRSPPPRLLRAAAPWAREESLHHSAAEARPPRRFCCLPKVVNVAL